MPALIARERERFRGYATRTMGGNLLADLLQHEVACGRGWSRSTPTRCCSPPTPVAFPYQLMIVPRRPRMRFEDDGPTGAPMLHQALRRLDAVLGASPPLSLWIRTAPQGAEHSAGG